jgi:hypothetical protein
MHRAADDADIFDGIRQPRARRNLLFHSQIDLPVVCLGFSARGIALRVEVIIQNSTAHHPLRDTNLNPIRCAIASRSPGHSTSTARQSRATSA